MNLPYNVDVYDNLINSAIQDKIWKYLQTQIWHQKWITPQHNVHRYRPVKGPSWFMAKGMHIGSSMHRCVLASDEDSLKQLHLPIYVLWKEINQKLDNAFSLTGLPEGMTDQETMAPTTTDPDLEPGWRAYVNASHNVQVSGNGYAHRDNPDLDQDDLVTILYVVNSEWYPSWGAELRFYPEDKNSTTGDHQQFNSGSEQSRNFNIGWLDQGRIVSPVPGRLVVYDGRCLHATTASGNPDIETPLIKVAFRARRIK